MIYINPIDLEISQAWKEKAKELTNKLIGLPPEERAEFINNKKNRKDTWGSEELLEALRKLVGNKCWYSEVPIEGFDPNVDHFRPKGSIREVDDNLNDTGKKSPGYWWLAFEYRNYRLSSMHANQRRVDTTTEGGKWDYFPINGERTEEKTPWLSIAEDVLALDPCSASDVKLLWFDPEGRPGCSAWRRKVKDKDHQRVRATIWLYHLDKHELQVKRGNHMRQIHTDLEYADAQYRLWKRDSASPNLLAKNSFDHKIAEIIAKISNKSEYSGAKQCAIRLASAEYDWIEEFLSV